MRRTFLITGLSIVSLAFAVVLLLALSQSQALAMQVSSDPTPDADPRLAVVHLAPFAADPNTAVTVTLDGDVVLTDFEFGDSTAYLTVDPGEHLVAIFVPGVVDPVLTATVDLMEDTDYTAIATGGANGWDLELLALVDDNTPPMAGYAHLRLGHLAPFAMDPDTVADVRLDDGTVILDDVPFGAVADYLPLPAGEYDLEITTPDGGTVLIDLAPVTLGDGDILSAFAVGDGANQDLGAYGLPAGVEGFFLPLESEANLQVAHLAPFAMDPGTAVTVTLNGVPALTDFFYGDSTEYIEVPPDNYLVEIYPQGSATPAISGTVDLMAGMDYTAIAIGDGVNQPLGLKALVDDNSDPDPGYAHLRLGHLAPFAMDPDTVADVRLDDGTVILDDVSFGAVTGYLPLPAGEYDLEITTPDGGTVLIDLAPVTLGDGDILSAFAVGDGANQDLGAYGLPAGEVGDFLLLEAEANLQVAHLAPFAMDPGTAVTVTLNGVPALTDFFYGDSTEYIEVPPDNYLVEIYPQGSATPAISGTVDLMAGMDYTAIAIGDGVNQPLSLKALVDDNSDPDPGYAHLRIGHLAPFAAVITDTWADVRLQDGTVILDDVPYGDVAPYMELPAGSYDLKITNADGSVTLIDPLPVTFGDGAILSVYAVGDLTNQPVGAFALPSGVEGFLLPLTGQRVYLPLVMR